LPAKSARVKRKPQIASRKHYKDAKPAKREEGSIGDATA